MGTGQSDLQALKDSVERTIYTPGSTGGIPVNILASFAHPQLDWDIHQELLRDKIASIITALLTLVGMRNIDPLRSREHILLSNILENAWRQNQSPSLQEIILQTQDPPFKRLGAFEVDTFFPRKDRGQLALLLKQFPGLALLSNLDQRASPGCGRTAIQQERQSPPQHLLHRPPG